MFKKFFCVACVLSCLATAATADTKVRFRLEFTNSEGVPIGVVREMSFDHQLRVYVEDVRDIPQGVLSAYLNVAMVDSVNRDSRFFAYEVEYAPGFSDNQAPFDFGGRLTVGASRESSPAGPGEQLLCTIKFLADATEVAGTRQCQEITTSSVPNRDTKLFGLSSAVDPSDIDYAGVRCEFGDQDCDYLQMQIAPVSEMPPGVTSAPMGDLNFDQHVDSDDLSLLLNNFGQFANSWSDGDLNCDGSVDSADLGLLLNNFGT